jgi:hypothetical protein
MGYAAMLNGTAAIVAAVLVIAAGAGLYLFRQTKAVEKPRFFAPRNRRLTFVERASLDSGRKLLLVRRDDVEHLIMIGGPIDLVIETGIRSQVVLHGLSKENGFAEHGLFSTQEINWPPREPSLSMDNKEAVVESKSPLSSEIVREKQEIKKEKEEEAASQPEAKAAKPTPQKEVTAAE